MRSAARSRVAAVDGPGNATRPPGRRRASCRGRRPGARLVAARRRSRAPAIAARCATRRRASDGRGRRGDRRRAPAKAAEMLAEAAFAALYGDSPAADMDRLGRRALALAPAGAPRARGLAATALGAGLVIQGRAEAAEWLAEAAALADDDRGAARGRPGSPRWSASRPRSCAAAPTHTSRWRGRSLSPVSAAPRGCCRSRCSSSASACSRARAGPRRRPTSRRRCGSPARPGCASTPSPRWRRSPGSRRGAATRVPPSTRAPRSASLASSARRSSRPGRSTPRASWRWPAATLDAARTAFEAKAAVLAKHGMRDPDLSPAAELAEVLGRDDAARAVAAEALGGRRGQGPAVGARARPPRRRAGRGRRRRRDRRLRGRARRCTRRRTTSTSARAPSCACGERLRRAGRRADAREPLRSALERLRRARRHAVGRPRRRRAARDGRDGPAPRPVLARRADAAGAADRADARRRRHDAAGRGGALPQPEDRRVPPAPRLPEARRQLPRRAGGSAPGRAGPARRHWGWGSYGRASSTRLNGVSAARRTRVKPAVPSTSRRRASPAWAPSARPTSWESELGVHSSVENA